MTILKIKSERKKKAIIGLVKNGEYSIPFAKIETERYNDEGKLLDEDYEETMEYLESLEQQEEQTGQDNELDSEPVEDAQSEENASYTEEDSSMQDTNEQTNDESEE